MLSKEQREQFTKDFPHYLDSELAIKYGISLKCANLYGIRHGLHKTDETLRRRKESRGKNISLHYKARPGLKAKQMEGKLPSTIYKKGHNIREVIGDEGMILRNQKISKSKKELIAKERERIKYGLKQLTKMHFPRYPDNTRKFFVRLRNNGYIVDDVKMIAYFDDNTTRCPVIEARKPGDKYYRYMRFMPTSNYISR